MTFIEDANWTRTNLICQQMSFKDVANDKQQQHNTLTTTTTIITVEKVNFK